MKLYRDPGESSHRPQILTLFCVIIGAFGSDQLSSDSPIPLAAYKDDILSAFTSGLQTSAGREASLEGLKKLSQIHGILSEEELAYVVHGINEVLQSDDSTDDNYDARCVSIFNTF